MKASLAALSLVAANSVFAADELTMALTGAQGVSGGATISYDTLGGNAISINAQFDFTNFAPEAYTECAGATITAYSWHIHTEWVHGETVVEEAVCGADETAGHYDPIAVDHSLCALDAKSECEVGDLSGRYGMLTPDANNVATLNDVDATFLPFNEIPEGMSIVMHVGASDVDACTGTRIVCGRLDHVAGDYPPPPTADGGCQRRLRK